jgi:hypothetical protein
MPSSAAQDEFNALIHGTGRTSSSHPHIEDIAADEREQQYSADPTTKSDGKTIKDTSLLHSDSDSDSAPASRASNMRAKYYIPSTRSAANTGPKGVIADAQAFQQARRAHRSAAASRANLAVPSQYSEEPKVEDNRQSWLLDEDDDDSEHDDFLQRWRQNRLKEMQRRGGSPKSAAGGAPKYGNLTAVDAEGYLDAIEKVARDVVVVVFIYDDRVCFGSHLFLDPC